MPCYSKIAQATLLLFILIPTIFIQASEELAEAIDQPSLVFTRGGGGDLDAQISAQTTNSHDGIDVVEFNSTTNENEFWLQTTIEGPATISFITSSHRIALVIGQGFTSMDSSKCGITLVT